MLERVTPEAFASDTPPERIMGSEMEYSVHTQNGKTNDAMLWPLFEPANLNEAGIVYLRGEVRTRLWLANGAKIYKDIGDHWEYCTPESLGPRQMALAEVAGQLIADKIMSKAAPSLRMLRRAGTIMPDGQFSTKGFHINAITPETVRASHVSKLTPLLATRFYAWAGMVGTEGFTLSQKAMGLGGLPLEVDKGNRRTNDTGIKPMALLVYGASDQKNQPEFSRFEDRSNDPSTPWGVFMTAATNSLGLRILEHPKLEAAHKIIDKVQLLEPARDMRAVSDDLTLTRTFVTAAGETITAVNVQEAYHQAFALLSEEVQLPSDELVAIDELERVLVDTPAAIRNGDLRRIADREAWAAKLYYLQSKVDGPLNTNNRAALVRCLNFDFTYPAGGARKYAEQRGMAIGTAEEIGRLVLQPPEHTRAAVRGEYIRDPEKHKTILRLDWDRITRFGTERPIVVEPYGHIEQPEKNLDEPDADELDYEY